MSRPQAHLVVAIPAHNEADRIGGCLAALAGQRDAPAFAVVLFANNCNDATAAVANGWQPHLPGLHIISETLPPDVAHAGEARRRAMTAALELCGRGGVLMTTDADTVAPPHWIAANLAALAGVDAVAGRAVIDPVEARAIPAHLHEIDARECAYAALLDEIDSLLRPLAHDPWPRHDEHSGASIAVRVAAYRACGGVPPQPSGEDRALIAALHRSGARVRHAPEVWVTVSGRLEGRARGGMADTIRHRLTHTPVWLDDRLEPLRDRLARLHGDHAAPPVRVAVSDVDRQIRLATIVRDRLRSAAAEVARPPATHGFVVPRTRARLRLPITSAARLAAGPADTLPSVPTA